MKIQRIAFFSVALSLASVAGQAQAFDPHCFMRKLGLGWSDGYHAQPCCNSYGRAGCCKRSPAAPYHHGVAVQSAPTYAAPFPHSFAVQSGATNPIVAPRSSEIQLPSEQVQMMRHQKMQQLQAPGPAVQQPTNTGPLPPSIQQQNLQAPLNHPLPTPNQQSRFQPASTNRQAMNGHPLILPTQVRHPHSVLIQEPNWAPRTSAPMMSPGDPTPTQPNFNATDWRQSQPTSR